MKVSNPRLRALQVVVILAGFGILADHTRVLDADKWRKLVLFLVFALMAEWLFIPLNQGGISLSTFLVTLFLYFESPWQANQGMYRQIRMSSGDGGD